MFHLVLLNGFCVRLRGAVRVRTVALLLIPALFFLARNARAEWLAGAGVGAVYDDNLSRAVKADERKSDIAALANASFGYHLQPTGSTGLAVTTSIKDSTYARYPGLDLLEAGLELSMKYKSGLGSYAPWLSAFGSSAYRDCRESMHSGTLTTLGLRAGQRLDVRTFAYIEYMHDDARARNAAFDTAGSTVSIKGDYLLTESTQLSLGYAVRRGTSVIYGPVELGPYGYSEGFVVTTFDTPLQVYSVRTDTQTLSIGENTQLDGGWSTTMGIDYRVSRSEDYRYSDTAVRAVVSYTY